MGLKREAPTHRRPVSGCRRCCGALDGLKTGGADTAQLPTTPSERESFRRAAHSPGCSAASLQGARDFALGCSAASLQGARWLRCKVLGGFDARCSMASLQGGSVASLQGARRLRCRVLGGFAARCSATSLQGARRLRCKVLGDFAARCSATSLQGARRLRCKVLGGSLL